MAINDDTINITKIPQINEFNNYKIIIKFMAKFID